MWELKALNPQKSIQERTKCKEKRREEMAFDLKSPPVPAKGGAPASSSGLPRKGENPRGLAEETEEGREWHEDQPYMEQNRPDWTTVEVLRPSKRSRASG
jgi:hypothetical protein